MMKLTYNVREDRWYTPDGLPCIQIQAIGLVPSKPVRDFAPGDIMGWNYGSATMVARVEPVGKAMCDVHMVGWDNPRRMKLDRLTAIASKRWRVVDKEGAKIDCEARAAELAAPSPERPGEHCRTFGAYDHSVETLWCETCGEAPASVRLDAASLCDGCAESCFQEVLAPMLGYTPCCTVVWPNGQPALCMVEAGSEHAHA